MRSKLPIAVSSCLLGNKVRYDGLEKSHAYIRDELSEYFSFQVICPEVEIGLSVPRPPIQLVRVNDVIQAVSIGEPAIDFTQRLKQHAWLIIPSLKDINAYIFKARSPSCGVGTTPLNLNPQTDAQSEMQSESGHETSNGIFAQEILNAYPGLPIIDESQLESGRNRLIFLNSVFEYAEKSKRD